MLSIIGFQLFVLSPRWERHEMLDAHVSYLKNTCGLLNMFIENDRFNKQVERAREKIKNHDINPADKKAILAFSDYCFSEGLSAVRVLKYLHILSLLSRRFKKEFHKAKRCDIEKIVNAIERSGYAEWTKHDHKVTLKKFFRWLRKSEDEYPPEVKWIRTTMKKKRIKLPDEILTSEEVQAMIIAAQKVRDKALIASLYESGCRICELLSLKIKHIQQHPHGFQITVTSMKGSRRLLLINSTPYITEWLNQHPRGNDLEAPLWISADFHKRQMRRERVRILLKSIAKRAGVHKAVNPHNFRHSRATHLANHLTEAQMNEYFGWVQGSDMPSTYVHLSGRDVDNALLKLNGVRTDKEQEGTAPLKMKNCIRCDLNNPATHTFCHRCGHPLNKNASIMILKQNMNRKEADNLLDTMLEDTRFKNVFQTRAREVLKST